MQEKMTESYEELKRVEHLIYVSLKYTRTVDVILNILNRMTDGYALMVDALVSGSHTKTVLNLLDRLCFHSYKFVVDSIRFFVLRGRVASNDQQSRLSACELRQPTRIPQRSAQHGSEASRPYGSRSKGTKATGDRHGVEHTGSCHSLRLLIDEDAASDEGGR
jgi:hypothetical protein